MGDTLKWNELTLAQQMVNIGTEVNRALKAKESGKEERMLNECIAALNLLALSISDDRNIYRREELHWAERILIDYFLDGNKYNSTPQQISRYYSDFYAMIG